MIYNRRVSQLICGLLVFATLQTMGMKKNEEIISFATKKKEKEYKAEKFVDQQQGGKNKYLILIVVADSAEGFSSYLKLSSAYQKNKYFYDNKDNYKILLDNLKSLPEYKDYDNSVAYLFTWENKEKAPENLVKTITDINETVEKLKGECTVVTLSYYTSSPIVDKASQEITINTMIHLDPFIDYYSYGSTSYFGGDKEYIINSDLAPKNYDKIYNLYSKGAHSSSLRKYIEPTKIEIKDGIPSFKVRNILLGQISDDTITSPTGEDFHTTDFISNIAPIILASTDYKLNNDLLAVYPKKRINKTKEEVEDIIYERKEDEDVIKEFKEDIKMEDAVVNPYVVINRVNNFNLEKEEVSISYVDNNPYIYKIKGLEKDVLKNAFTRDIDISYNNLTQLRSIKKEAKSFFDLSKDIDISEITTRNKKAFDNELYLQSGANLFDNKSVEKIPLAVKDRLNLKELYRETPIGGKYVYELYYGDKSKIPTSNQKEYLDSIIAIAWYLYSEAINKGQAFLEGTYVIHDQDLKLYNFLMGYAQFVNKNIKGDDEDTLNIVPWSDRPYAYPRPSSHFEYCQKYSHGKLGIYNLEVGGNIAKKRFTHYGIDIQYDVSQPTLPLLPNGKKHLLFGLLDKDKEIIYIKPESAGLYTYEDIYLHGMEFAGYKETEYKISEKCKYLLKYKKGEVNPKLSEAIKLIIENDKDESYDKEHINHLGLQYLATNKIIPKIIFTLDQEKVDHEKLYLYDHLHMRYMDEVVLTPSEFLSSIYYYDMQTGNKNEATIIQLALQLLNQINDVWKSIKVSIEDGKEVDNKDVKSFAELAKSSQELLLKIFIISKDNEGNFKFGGTKLTSLKGSAINYLWWCMTLISKVNSALKEKKYDLLKDRLLYQLTEYLYFVERSKQIKKE